MNKNKTYLLLISILIITNVFFAAYLFVENLQSPPAGKIIFQRNNALYLTDTEGKDIQFLRAIDGFSPSLSKDGAYIATGCNEGHTICIIDTKTIPNWRTFPLKFPLTMTQTIQEIPLPEACLMEEEKPKEILSLDWSQDNKQLVLVCDTRGDTQNNNSVCVLSLDGKASCWSNEASQDIRHAVWSPTQNLLAISAGFDMHAVDPGIAISKIYLVNPDGQGKTLLTEGWNPEWSPDGKEIAFVRWGKNRYPGIGIISLDGTDFHWVYESPILIDDEKEGVAETETANQWTADDALYFGCSDIGSVYGCRLAWSPDGRYLAFSANQSWLTETNLLRLDLKTNEIIFLILPDGHGGKYIEADWAP